MISFNTFILREAYKRYLKLRDKLSRIEPLIDWEAFRPIIASSCKNLTEKGQGGRPNIDPIVMLKLLVLQQWYGLSDRTQNSNSKSQTASPSMHSSDSLMLYPTTPPSR